MGALKNRAHAYLGPIFKSLFSSENGNAPNEASSLVGRVSTEPDHLTLVKSTDKIAKPILIEKMVGEAKITKITDQSLQNILIKKVKFQGNIIFTAYLQSPEAMINLGYITINHLRLLSDNMYGYEQEKVPLGFSHSFSRYGQESEVAKADRVFCK